MSTLPHNENMFLVGDGHLPEQAAEIAQEHGATLTNYTEPGTGKRRHWFSCANLGSPHNEATERGVRADLERVGILEDD